MRRCDDSNRLQFDRRFQESVPHKEPKVVYDFVVKKLTEQVSDPRLQQSLQETVELARSTLAIDAALADAIAAGEGDVFGGATFIESLCKSPDV